MSNTPLNADDELLTKMRRLGEKYYGNELYGEHLQYQHELQELILADRNKHELQAKKNGFYMAAGLFGADISRVEELWDKCEQELEKL